MSSKDLKIVTLRNAIVIGLLNAKKTRIPLKSV